ncbi:hypothetical protein [uncultured Desulfobacter sp.]|uniref:hypothetical protein n=1 Tax=uncultured Desulfobacter sp. TaxID=240139 RepID=UPI002AAC0A72|nr:hypothetical protein [uncultured Desulfobacter sp.]
MDDIARIGSCGFVTKADKLLTGSGMGQFVKDVFLTEKVKGIVQAPVVTPVVEKVWVVNEAYFDFN